MFVKKGKRGSITNFIDRVSFVSGSSIHLLNLDALLDHLVRALFDHQPPPPPPPQLLLLQLLLPLLLLLLPLLLLLLLVVLLLLLLLLLLLVLLLLLLPAPRSEQET